MMDLRDDPLHGRVWPEREYLTVDELICAFESVMRVEPRLDVHLNMYGGNDSEHHWSVSGRMSIDGYMSAEEFDRLRAALAEHGMYPYIGGVGSDEGAVSIAIGSKTRNGITTRWERSTDEPSAVQVTNTGGGGPWITTGTRSE